MKNLTIYNLQTNRGGVASNQIVIKDTEKRKVSFYSYNILIASYDEVLKKITLFDKWDYSNTTLRYLKQFMEHFTTINYISKQSLNNRLENINYPNITKSIIW